MIVELQGLVYQREPTEFLHYQFAYLVVEETDLAAVQPDRQALEKRDVVLSKFIVLIVDAEPYELCNEWLRQHETHP